MPSGPFSGSENQDYIAGLANIINTGPTAQPVYQGSQQQPSGWEGKAGQSLNIVDHFLSGLSRGRALSYQRSQEQKQQTFGALSDAMQRIQTSDLPDNIKQQQLAQLGEMRGNVFMQALGGDEKGSKGKGKQGGEQEGPGHHILNAVKGIATSMLGPGAQKQAYDHEAIKARLHDTSQLLANSGQISAQHTAQLDQGVIEAATPLIKANGGQPLTYSQFMSNPDAVVAAGKNIQGNGGTPTPALKGMMEAMQSREKEEQAKTIETQKTASQEKVENKRAETQLKLEDKRSDTQIKVAEAKAKEDAAREKSRESADDRRLGIREAGEDRRAKLRASGEGGGSAAKEIADAIVSGDQPPDLKSFYRYSAPVRAELAKQKYNLTAAERDWQAVTKHIATLNGPQQTRIVENVNSLHEMLPAISDAYDAWQKTGLPGGYRSWNKAALAASAQLPGEKGKVAQNLITYINDAVSETGQIYMGGNSPTDHALLMAQKNLQGDWNAETFKSSLDILEKNLTIRRNSILNSPVVGASQNSSYIPDNMRSVTGEPPPAAGTATPPAPPQQRQTATPPAPRGQRGTATPPQVALPKPSTPGQAISKEDVAKYLDANGGDPQKARAAAQKDNWKF